MNRLKDDCKTVAGSPFRATVTETAAVDQSAVAKVKCYGAGLQPSAVHKGQKAVFTVDASQSSLSGAPVSVTTTNLNTGPYLTYLLYSTLLYSSLQSVIQYM